MPQPINEHEGGKLLDSVTATGAGTAIEMNSHAQTFQASITGTGAVTATVVVEVSNDGSNYLTLGTITLSGTDSDSDGFASSAAWTFVRGNVTAISGTSAAVTLTMGG